MYLNSYVIDTKDIDKVILFNPINGTIVSLPEKNFLDREIVDLENHEQEFLKENGFFDSDNNVLEFMEKVRKRKSSELLDITISFTQNCNLACLYCSQWNSKDVCIIEKKNLDYLVEYIYNCINELAFKRVSITLFGGEPLLQKDKILYFKERLENKVDFNCISYSLITNGVLLDSIFLSKFSQLNIYITLSLKNDHDKYRVFHDGSGSFDIIINNLINYKDYFVDKVKLNIRHNLGENINDFEDFLIFLKNLKININGIQLAYTYPLDYTKYENHISLTEYARWYIHEGIDLLIKYGYKVEFPPIYLGGCRAYGKYNLKMFPDGKLANCNGENSNLRKGHISEVSVDISNVESILSEVKHAAVLTEKCKKCKYLLLCCGNFLCRKNNCHEFLEYSVEDFLIKYSQLSEYVKKEFFDI